MENFFQYGETEIAYLKQVDKRMAEVIDRIGKVERRVIPDFFAALVHSIVGQQISTKAHETIWRRMENALGQVTPEAIDRLSVEELQGFGITFKKAAYIRNATQQVLDGTLDIQSLYMMNDNEVCTRLSELDGIGVWSAEMLMLFSMQRPDILSFGDLAIQRGLRMVYHHRKITRELFEKYRRRFSPYNSVASLYLWAVAGGAIEGMKDYAPKKQAKWTTKKK
ncbi:MAG TPA: DNA-3-methyladenine glycosylase 2 family protein [Candidatus Bacteroides pullicola]|uniref:DNA-3-methyladenine glycosylase II n=1 Tax=Candidatus Bacteroides pullicola TaxID=2838475 RepID=A0A9D1ZJ91_9BACE|nr:DNA-3-methyladenine glycosylase 2 family protein [Candidatus Bacteroides pullicola]